MPPSDIERLIGRMVISPSFAKSILDPDKRREALGQFQKPRKLITNYEVGREPEGIHLTPQEIQDLMKIKAKTPEEFFRGCLEAGLTENPKPSPESGQ